MARERKNRLCRARRCVSRSGAWEAPAAFASVSSSQSPEFCWRVQGEGWSDIISSRTVLRAAKTFSEFVTTFMPGSTGRTQEAASTRAPVSTTQSRQTPTGVWLCRWQSVGMLKAVHARGIENTRACGHADGLAVEDDVNEARRCGVTVVMLGANANVVAPRQRAKRG